jgi:hypothetical protein
MQDINEHRVDVLEALATAPLDDEGDLRDDQTSPSPRNMDLPDHDVELRVLEDRPQENPPCPPRPSWEKLGTLADAFCERPPIEYVIDGLFPLPSLSIVYGYPGDFKSMLLMDAAISVAVGEPWLPSVPDTIHARREVRQVPVFWYDCDNGQRRCDERFRALAKARGLSSTSEIPFYYLSIPDRALDANDRESVHEVLKPKILEHGIRFICIDNLSTVSGGADENSIEMSGVMRNLRKLVEDTYSACVIIHHQRKSKDTKENRAGESLRGHSSINAAIDLALHIERMAERVTIESTKTRGMEVLPFGAEFTYTSRVDGELETARFRGFPVESRTNGNKAAIEATILTILQEKRQLNQSKVIEEAQKRGYKGKETVRKSLEALVADGRVIMKEGTSKNAKLYSLP